VVMGLEARRRGGEPRLLFEKKGGMSYSTAVIDTKLCKIFSKRSSQMKV